MGGGGCLTPWESLVIPAPAASPHWSLGQAHAPAVHAASPLYRGHHGNHAPSWGTTSLLHGSKPSSSALLVGEQSSLGRFCFTVTARVKFTFQIYLPPTRYSYKLSDNSFAFVNILIVRVTLLGLSGLLTFCSKSNYPEGPEPRRRKHSPTSAL